MDRADDRKGTKPILEIDGLRFAGLDQFWDEISVRLVPGVEWGRNLDALNDILRGGFGTPKGGFVFRWLNSQRSRSTLGYPETLRWLEGNVRQIHPDNVDTVKKQITIARLGRGPTLFHIIVNIIQSHGPGGMEEENRVDLELL